MQIYAVIAEYNPFHKGHMMHLQAARAAGATHIVAIMGGNFLQRGDAALLDKHRRAHAALLGGADLVLELPLPYACATAERFAFGGVGIAHALGCVDTLSFGSECGNAALIMRVAEAIDSPGVSEKMRELLGSGMTFARARQLAVEEVFPELRENILGQPNNILGIEYARQLLRLKSGIKLHTVSRFGAGHHSALPVGGIASASYIRKLVLGGESEKIGELVPFTTREIINEAAQQGCAPASMQLLDRAVLAKLRGMSRADFAALPDISEGLENRLYAAVQHAISVPELLTTIKTKRYTLSRLRRIVLSAFLSIKADMAMRKVPYIRVLGMNARGGEVLSVAKKSSILPISHSLAKLRQISPAAAEFARLEAYAGDVFALATPTPQPCGEEFRAGIVKV